MPDVARERRIAICAGYVAEEGGPAVQRGGLIDADGRVAGHVPQMLFVGL